MTDEETLENLVSIFNESRSWIFNSLVVDAALNLKRYHTRYGVISYSSNTINVKSLVKMLE